MTRTAKDTAPCHVFKPPMNQPEESTILHTGEFLQTCRSGTWEYVRRVRSNGGAAFMIATTDADEIVLVEQYRVPAGKRVIELPAGIIGDEDGAESNESAALRELEEETGFRANHIELLHDAPTAGGLTSEWAWHFRLSGLSKVGNGGGVDGENIITHCVPRASAARWLAEQKAARDVAVDARVYAALFWLLQETPA